MTERASQAAVTQRAGRAARQGPGVAYRLWEEAATTGLPNFDPPEIHEADLTALVLDCAIWGADPTSLNWLDPPPAAALAEASSRLGELGATDANGKIAPHGRAIAALPVPPRLAHMIVRGREAGMGSLAGKLAVLLGERGLGGNDADLEVRLRRWQTDRGKRAEASRQLARRLGGDGGDGGNLAWLIAQAFPDRIARRRDASGEQWLGAGGRGYRFDATHPLARSTWLAVADVQGSAAGARILSAVSIDEAEVEQMFADRIEAGITVRFDVETRSAKAESGRRLGAIQLSKAANAVVAPEALSAALLQGVREHGLAMLDWPEAASSLRKRARWADLDALSDEALVQQLDDWLEPLLSGKRRLGDIDAGALTSALRNRLSWDEQRQLDTRAPCDFISPAGSSHAINYSAEAGPTVELRVQALFGLSEHPSIGPGQTPLVLSLTSPAGRPIQTTRDLPGFWRGSWADVAKEMRGRYPRHNWPDDPTQAPASLKTKKALDRLK